MCCEDTKGSDFFHTSECSVNGCRNRSLICCFADRIVHIGVNDLLIFYPLPKPCQEPHSRNRDLISEKISEFINRRK